MSESESFSSDSLEIQFLAEKPEFNQISSFFVQFPFISTPVSFLEKVSHSYSLVSDDSVLATVLLANYNEIKGCIEKRFKKTLNSLTENLQGTVAYFFCPRISNLPLNEIYELYSKVELSFDHYIFVSRLYKVEKDEISEISNSFKEFSPNDLRYFPYYNEEVFLLSAPIKQNTEVKNSQARICVLTKENFKEFLKSFAHELSQ